MLISETGQYDEMSLEYTFHAFVMYDVEMSLSLAVFKSKKLEYKTSIKVRLEMSTEELKEVRVEEERWPTFRLFVLLFSFFVAKY